MSDSNKRPLAFIILDGWGHSNDTERNAIASAHTPNYDELCRSHPMTTLASSGESVGLRKGEPGNPEAGHLNLGAGRVLPTDKHRIDEAIDSGEFFENEILVGAIQDAVYRGAAVHVAGLLSDADIHSSIEHLFALLRLAKQLDLPQVYIHCFLDGRDTPVKTADVYVEALEVKASEIGIGQIATLCGRYFTMDDGGNWERTARAYTMMVHSEGENVLEPKKAIRDAFVRGYSDEFIRPIVVEKQPGVPIGQVRDGDLVIFFNHRGDTLSQLLNSMAASGSSYPEPFAKPKIEIVTLTEYDHAHHAKAAFPHLAIQSSLASTLADHGWPSFRITESERSPHLESFIGRRTDAPGGAETLRSVAPALRTEKPEMSSFKITDRFVHHMDSADEGFFVVNLPAQALAAESGDFEKTVEAVQFVDTCLGGILEKVREKNGIAIVTASHASCEEMKPRAAGNRSIRASFNSVPFHVFDPEAEFRHLRNDGAIEDVAPTVLAILGIEKPEEMTGRDLWA